MKISRQAYAEMYGPTRGDRVRLGDTALVIRIERDFTSYGDEVKRGCRTAMEPRIRRWPP